jgi:hypothetical protein
MPYDVSVVINDLPGALAQVGETMGKAGINIEGYCSFSSAGKSYLHILVDEMKGVQEALGEIGVEVEHQREVFTVDVEDRPGELGKVTRHIADSGVNIDMVYMGTNTRLVLCAFNTEAARAAIDRYEAS